MAGVRFFTQTVEMALGAGSKKTVLQILAAANHRVKVREFALSFDGTSNSAQPVLCELERQSSAGSGGDVLTPVNLNSDDSETVQAFALSDIDGSTQPAVTAVLMRENVHPQGGYTYQAPFGGDFEVPGGERLGLSLTAAVTVNVVARFVCEE